MGMKIPHGKRRNILVINGRKVRHIIEDTVKMGINGYLRVTTEGEGLEDYYLLLNEAGVAGAYGELDRGAIEGQEALERAVEITEGVVDLCTLDQGAVKGLLLKFPNLRVKGLEHGMEDVWGPGGYEYGSRREALMRRYNLKDPSEEFVDSLVQEFLGGSSRSEG